MPYLRSRRQIVSSAIALSAAAASGKVWAQAKSPDQGTLARLRTAKTVTVGVANFLPYSGIDPDGTLTGMAPTLTKLIMDRLGVPEIKGISAGYGQLIPGMQAGRWEFICAALTISKARCSQVAYADPIVFDGGSFVSLKGELADPPKTLKEVVARKLTVGVSAGGAISRLSLESGVSPDNLKQFPDDVAMIDGLVAKRIQGLRLSPDRHGSLRRLPARTPSDEDVGRISDDRPPVRIRHAGRADGDHRGTGLRNQHLSESRRNPCRTNSLAVVCPRQIRVKLPAHE